MAATTVNWALPLYIHRKNKLSAAVVLGIVAAALYFTTNHYPIFEPRLLPMTWLDQAIPFLPHTVWIYTSEYYLFIAAYVLCKDELNLNRYAYSFTALQAVSALIFWAWPTTFPREQFPLPVDLDAATAFVFQSLRSSDSPNNCFPSLHVSSVYLSSFIFLDEQKERFRYFFIWATLIAITTLTTKQHYLADVVAGFILAVVFYLIFHRGFRYRPVGTCLALE